MSVAMIWIERSKRQLDHEHGNEKPGVNPADEQVHKATTGEDACHERSVRSRAA
jgi:hypothetical protein